MDEYPLKLEDRGRMDILSDPGALDLICDGEWRDMFRDPGAQDLVRDRRARESFRLEVLLSGHLPEEICLAISSGLSGGFAASKRTVD